MASYNYGIGTSGGFGSSARSASSGGSDVQYARVVDVIVDSNHPRYSEFERSLGLYGIIYRPLGGPAIEDKDALKFFAYRSNSTFTKIPLIGEIVEIYRAPSEFIDASFGGSKKVYYRSIVEIWNLPHLNLFPDVYQDEQNQTNPDPGFDFVDRDDLLPLQIFPGDVTIEGRYGQSIRFSGTSHRDNIYTDGSNNGKAFTIFRNGQGVEGKPGVTGVEDINRDATSIYLMSDHSVPLEQANYKRLSYDDSPDEAHVYKGKQLIINSGRIFLNAKEESILLSGTESVGLNARTINLDGEDYLALDADKIYLGEKARRTNRKEPVVLGLQYEAWLKDLIAILKSMARDFSTVLTPPQAAAVLSKQGTSINSKLPALQAAIKNTLSKKVYSE